jgi:hypothetical protein
MLKRIYNRIYENPKYLATGLAIVGGLIALACVVGVYVYLTNQAPAQDPQKVPPSPVVEELPPKMSVPQTINAGTNSVALPEEPSD